MSLLSEIKRALAAFAILSAIVIAATFLVSDHGRASAWTFLDPASLAELGLVAHSPQGGAWGLEEHEPATGGRALANHEGSPGANPAMLVALEPRARDVRARTRCKVMGSSMSADAIEESPASCGVVFRFVDENNHWIVRADASSGAIEVATVVGGRERVVGRATMPSAQWLGAWMELNVEVRGDIVRVTLDDRPLLTAEVATVPAASGAVGLWVPAGTTAFFDHFAIETLSASPRALEILPLLGRRPG